MAVIWDFLANLIPIKISNFLEQPNFQILLDRVLTTNLFLNSLIHQQVEVFYKIVVPLLKIQQNKEEFLVKTIHFSSK